MNFGLEAEVVVVCNSVDEQLETFAPVLCKVRTGGVLTNKLPVEAALAKKGRHCVTGQGRKFAKLRSLWFF